jgi:hypothetical protein
MNQNPPQVLLEMNTRRSLTKMLNLTPQMSLTLLGVFGRELGEREVSLGGVSMEEEAEP